jgi:hypothetical protein
MLERGSGSGGGDSCRVMGRLVGNGISLATLMTCALWAPAQAPAQQGGEFAARGLGLPTLGARLRLVAGLRQLFCRPPPQPADVLLSVLGGAPKAAEAARAAVAARGGGGTGAGGGAREFSASSTAAPAATAEDAALRDDAAAPAAAASAQASVLASPEELAATAARVRLRSKAVPIAGLYALADVQQWSEKQVLKFLKMHGLGAYGAAFSEEAIDGECLLDCADWGGAPADVEFITGGRPAADWRADFPEWERDFPLLREIADVWRRDERAES